MIDLRTITVYCASSSSAHREYYEAAEQFASLFVKNKIRLKYGAGSVGLMGAIANSILDAGGEVIGVIPEFMIALEWQNKRCTELVVTKTMMERKQEMMKDTDAVLALPGGCGTFEELLEVMTLKRLGRFSPPIILFNQRSYYDPLLQMLERAVEENFMAREHLDLWTVITKPEELIPAIQTAKVWDKSASETAVV